ncbi:transmembrane protein 214-like isoform X4 [Dermacentor albipictus]|uniref:transmembrane protein 214-like isoform X4 n=1 Tax=Dermacentor albipictus TaxID=60249 RepID=UPI0031FDBCA5
MEKPIKEASQQPTLPHPNRLPAPKVSAYEVSELVLEKRLRFPINFLFWAKDLVFYLNSQLEGAPAAESQPPFEGRPAGFPLNELAAKVRRQLEDIIGGTNDEARSHLWDHCLNGALQALAAPSGGQNTGSCNVVGYMVCLQLLASRHPHIVTNALPKLRNLRSQHEGRPMACLALLWAASQAGLSSLSAGLAVWLELLMPVVGKRAYAPHVIDILSELLSRHPASKNGDENAGRACNLGVRSLFPLLDAVYGVGGRLPLSPERERALRDQLYPRIRDLCYAADPSRSAYFPSYLRRLGSGSAQLNAELLTSLEECLCRDPECLSVWRQLFERHAPQSMLLVQHLETKDAWRRLPCLTQRPPQATLISWRSTTPTSEGALRDALTQCQSTASKLEDLATLYQSLQKAAISAEQNPVAERQAFAVQLLHGVPDFEEGDFEDPTMGVPYAQEIFDYLAYLEERWPIKTGFLQVQPTVTPEMRSTLINWLMQVHWHYRLYHEILFLAVSLIDRVLQANFVEHNLANFVLELCLLDYRMAWVPPSKQAAAALCLSLRLFDKEGENSWGALMAHYGRYTEEALQPTIKRMAELLLDAPESIHKAPYKKYKHTRLGRVSGVTVTQAAKLRLMAGRSCGNAEDFSLSSLFQRILFFFYSFAWRSPVQEMAEPAKSH